MPSAVKQADKPHRLRVRLLIAALLAVMVAVFAGMAYRYYLAQKEAIEHEVRNELLSIADFKVAEISNWHTRQTDEVLLLVANGPTARVMQRLASGAPAPAESAEIHTWLDEVCSHLHYSGATFVDRHGNPILSAGKKFGDADHIRQTAEEVLRTNAVVFHDLRSDAQGNAIHMGLNVPLRASSDAPPFGALLLSIDPADRLYPLRRALEGLTAPSLSPAATLAGRKPERRSPAGASRRRRSALPE